MFENNPLTLVVKEKTLGNLVTNAVEIKAFVEGRVKDYSPENYKGDTAQAAKAKAELNAAAKKLNDERIALEREWNLPFQEFKNIISETTDLIKTASRKLDDILKAKEEEEKAEKQKEIRKIWESKQFPLVPLEKVFNPRWLNKTYRLNTVETDIDLAIEGIRRDLSVLDGYGEDTAALKELYLSTLSLQATLAKGAELKANRKKLEEVQKEAGKVKSVPPEKTEVRHRPSAGGQDREVFVFGVRGAVEVLDLVKKAAGENGLAVVPSFSLAGTAEDIAVFRERLSDSGLTYKKKTELILVVPGKGE